MCVPKPYSVSDQNIFIYIYTESKWVCIICPFVFFFPPQCMQVIKIEPINFKITCIENFVNLTNKPQNSQNLHIKSMLAMCDNVEKIIIYGLSQREHFTFWSLLTWRIWTLWADSKTSEKDLFCYWVLGAGTRGVTPAIIQGGNI